MRKPPQPFVPVLKEDGAWLFPTAADISPFHIRLPPLGPIAVDDTKPWNGNEACDWTIAQLDARDKAFSDGLRPSPSTVRTFAFDHRAIAEADCGNYEPLRKLYPRLARHLNPPKLKRGQRLKKPFRWDLPAHQWDRNLRIWWAIADLPRIRAIWKANGFSCRRDAAIEIAAERWEVSENDVRKGIPRKKG
jgi:hypothetical protein